MDIRNDNDLVDYVLDYFDADKVHRVMEFLDWHWNDCGGVALPGEIRQKARTLLRDAVSSVQAGTTDTYILATGGLRVEAYTHEGNPQKYLHLSFVVTDWDNFD